MTEPAFRLGIRVAICSGHPVVRAGLKALLDNRAGLQVVGEARNAAELPAVAQAGPDVLVLDPDSNDVTIESAATPAGQPTPRVIVYTGRWEWNTHERAFLLGALGVVLKSEPIDILIRAIQKVHAGQVWLERDRTASLLTRLVRPHDAEQAKVATLTRRERQIVDLVGHGTQHSAIAERLCISAATVRNHLTSILSKLGLSNRYELAVYSFRHGLVEAVSEEPMVFRAGRVARAPRR